METGTVVRFDEFRGYGFIAPDSGGDDVFMHVNDMSVAKNSMSVSARVAFAVESSGKGLKASQVRLLEQAGARPVAQASRPATAIAPASPEARPVRTDAPEDGLCDELSSKQLAKEIVEALLVSVPTLTGEQIFAVRQRMVELANSHGWLES